MKPLNEVRIVLGFLAAGYEYRGMDQIEGRSTAEIRLDLLDQMRIVREESVIDGYHDAVRLRIRIRLDHEAQKLILRIEDVLRKMDVVAERYLYFLTKRLHVYG
jgi:hypothetical protein